MRLLKFPPLFLFILTIISCNTSKFEEETTLYEETGQQLETTKVSVSAFEMAVHEAVNEHRNSIGLKSLVFSEEAYPIAGEHSKYMVEKGKLSHDNFNKRASKIAKKTKAKHVAENIARNYDTAEEVLQGWLKSKSHKNTIEGKFTHSAINIKKDLGGNYYYTQVFFRK